MPTQVVVKADTFSLQLAQGMATSVDTTEHKRVEQALRESEERFRTLVQFSFDVYWESDAQHRFTRQEFAKGLANAPAPGSEIGKTRWEVPYLEPGEEAWREHRKTLDAHLPFRDFELARPTPDGGKRYVSVSGLPVFDETGRFLGYRGIGRDITKSKRAEEALRDSEEKWRAVFENNPTMYFMVDAAGTVLSVNPLGAEQLGYTVEELTGASVLNVFHEADRTTALQNTANCLQQLGRTATWELRKVRKDGSMLWVRETARAMQTKSGSVVLIACEDITERKRAEYLTGQVFEVSPDAISVVGRDYRYQRVSPGFERARAASAERVVGRHVADVFGAEFFERAIKPYVDRCFAGEEVQFAEWFSFPFGRRYLSVTYSPLRPNSEHVEACLSITRDLTDHMLASEALHAAQAELGHVSRVATMGQLTASIAHEVNQPIAAAVTNAQAAQRWLERYPPELREVRLALGRIIENARRAGNVLERIRGLVTKAPPRKDQFDLNEAVLDVIALTRSEVLRHGVSLQTRLAAGLPQVEGDRVQLQQVMLNLIMNAIEAMSGDGAGPRELHISTEADAAGGVLATVRDSGPGLEPASANRIFEAFYTTKPQGMGMGLAICRSIIEAHGGRLWFAANEPRGAVFRFTLAAAQNETVPV